ncbi:MAG: hypothetical protein IH840_06320 [Candidatus Heimdallarchaeota archaeon]|nr:hypothetical protein [Candidatus Heimdallarchaeota archaeon]
MCWATLSRDSKKLQDHYLYGKILRDRLVDMFEELQVMQVKLLEQDHGVSHRIYEKAL